MVEVCQKCNEFLFLFHCFYIMKTTMVCKSYYTSTAFVVYSFISFVRKGERYVLASIFLGFSFLLTYFWFCRPAVCTLLVCLILLIQNNINQKDNKRRKFMINFQRSFCWFLHELKKARKSAFKYLMYKWFEPRSPAREANTLPIRTLGCPNLLLYSI